MAETTYSNTPKEDDTPPTLYIKSALKVSEWDGEAGAMALGDGTIYGAGTGATANSTLNGFLLIGMSLVPYIGSNADGKFTGYMLRFPASGNCYHIVAWLADSGGGIPQATVYENANVNDYGPWEIRKALVCNRELAGNPAHFLADGLRSFPWKSQTNTVIEAHLPNLIDNGGFETGVLAPWIKGTSGGTSDTTAVNSTTPILGSRDLKINRGDRTYVEISQTARTLYKNRTYRLLFKARYSGTFTSSQFYAQIYRAGIDCVFSSPSGGTNSTGQFFPTLTTSNAWYSVTITTPAWDVVGANLSFIHPGSFDVYIDEIYLFEMVNVAALLIFDGSGYITINNVTGRQCTKDRTGVVAGVDSSQLLSTQTLTGGDAALVEFTPGIYPVYTIDTQDLVQAGEILLAEKWQWAFDPDSPFAPTLTQKDETIFKTRGGSRRTYKHSQVYNIKGKYTYISPVDAPIWKNSWYPHHHRNKHAFGFRFDSTSQPILLEDQNSDFGLMLTDTTFPSVDFDWIEVK